MQVSAWVLGLAVAFAAQNTIANVFGAFSILGSHLFKVGDWVRLNDDIEGRVEKIGFPKIPLILMVFVVILGAVQFLFYDCYFKPVYATIGA